MRENESNLVLVVGKAIAYNFDDNVGLEFVNKEHFKTEFTKENYVA